MFGDVGEFGGDIGGDDEGVAAAVFVAGAPEGAGIGAPGGEEGFEQVGGERLIDVDHENAGWLALKGVSAGGQRGGAAFAEAGIDDDAGRRALQRAAYFVLKASDDHDQLVDCGLCR